MRFQSCQSLAASSESTKTRNRELHLWHTQRLMISPSSSVAMVLIMVKCGCEHSGQYAFGGGAIVTIGAAAQLVIVQPLRRSLGY
jgi:hypothetical protein